MSVVTTGPAPAIPAAWGATSHVVDLDGDVHYADFGGPPGADPVVLVHGLGGSYTNWGLLAPLLAERHRVLAPDLVGFGLTHPAGRSGSVSANARLLTAFLERVVGGPATLVGNSMGGMISMITAAARPDLVTGLVLLDAALPRVSMTAEHDRQVASAFAIYGVPWLGRWLLARRRREVPARRLVADTLAMCSPCPDEVPEEMVEAAVALVEARVGAPAEVDLAYLQAARSVLRFGARRRAYHALMRGLPMPVLMLHGEADRLIPVSSAHAVATRCPAWGFETFPGVGHIPMIEIPETVADRIETFLAAA
jgi:pimeloyl-ACP methyl ester carboxylesterase